MATIRISGIIIDRETAVFLKELFPALFDGGALTSPAEVIEAVENAGDSLDIRINSYGGDIFAGQEMTAAIRRWAVEHPKGRISYTVEALAASMAAAMLVLSPRGALISVYPESVIMFHSATTSLLGAGPGELKDTARCLDMFNRNVKLQLIERTSYAPAMVDEWFQDRRAGWLSGQDAVDYGLAGWMAGGEAPAMPPDPPDGALGPEAGKIAAAYGGIVALVRNHIKTERKMTKKIDNEEPLEPEKEQPEGDKEPLEPEKEEQPDGNEEPLEPEKEEQPDGNEESPEPEKKPDGDDLAELKAQNEELKRTVAELHRKLHKLTGGMRSPGGHETGAPTGFAAEFARMRAENLSPDDFMKRYCAARKADPSGFEEYLKTDKR